MSFAILPWNILTNHVILSLMASVKSAEHFFFHLHSDLFIYVTNQLPPARPFISSREREEDGEDVRFCWARALSRFRSVKVLQIRNSCSVPSPCCRIRLSDGRECVFCGVAKVR